MTAPAQLRRSRRRTPLTWLRGGGLSNLVFLAPMLIVFGLYSWGPIVQTVVMSFQKTNLITSHFVGFDNFVNVLEDPVLPTAILNTLYFALLALIFGFPLPILLAVLMSEVRRAKGFYSALAYLPVVVPPVVAVLLWKFFFDASPNGVFNTMLGWIGIAPQPWLQNQSTAMPSLVLEATWAAAGGSIIIYLAALLSVPPELLRRGRGRRGEHLAQGLAHHAAAVARRHLRDADPAGSRDRAGLPRAVPVHRAEAPTTRR